MVCVDLTHYGKQVRPEDGITFLSSSNLQSVNSKLHRQYLISIDKSAGETESPWDKFKRDFAFSGNES